MTRWLIASIVIGGSLSLRSASASPPTRPEASSRIVGIEVDQECTTLVRQLSSGGVQLLKIPDLSTYIPAAATTAPFSLNLPKTFVIPQDDEPKFDLSGNLRLPNFFVKSKTLTPSGPSFIFNGLRVYNEPVGFSPRFVPGVQSKK